MSLKLCQKHNPNAMPDAALDNLEPVWNAQVSISTSVCVNFGPRPGSGDLHDINKDDVNKVHKVLYLIKSNGICMDILAT